jgi:putative toxin-antitoxin system antitoxin component (TIGR02293 family)
MNTTAQMTPAGVSARRRGATAHARSATRQSAPVRPSRSKRPAVPPPTATAQEIVRFFGGAIARSSRLPNAKTVAERIFVPSDVPYGVHSVSSDAAARLIHGGVSASLVSAIAAAVPVEKALLLKVIGIDKATFRRREQSKGLLDPQQAEAAIRTMEIVTLAVDIFVTLDKAARWLTTPHPLLDGTRALEYASNHYGAEKVKSILFAIGYGGVV